MSTRTIRPLATQNVLIRGNRIAYGIFGTGKPVVLLHGTPSSSLIWRSIVPLLVDAGYQPHVFDLLGYGLSERPWDSQIDTSITGQVDILKGLLSHWDLQQFHLMAHDIGGAIAQRFTIENSDSVLTLAMIDVVSFDSYPSKRTRQQTEAGLESLIKVDEVAHRDHFRDYISGPVGQPSLFQHQIRHYDPKHTLEIADRYYELGDRPVKLIWGANDAWQVVGWAHRLQDAIPGSELNVVKDAGHFSLEDQPEDIAGLLIAFLDRHS